MEQNKTKKRIWSIVKIGIAIIVFAVLANIVYQNSKKPLDVFIPKNLPAEYSMDKQKSFPVEGDTRGLGYLVRFTNSGKDSTYQTKSDVNSACKDGDVASFREVKNSDIANVKVCSFIYENGDVHEKNYYFNRGENSIRIRDVNSPYLEISVIEQMINSLEAKESTNI